MVLQGNDPLYLDIYKQLLKNIEDGKYPNGKLPTEKETAEQYQVSRITTKKAFELLVGQGYIRRIPGRGSFVVPGRFETEKTDASADCQISVPDGEDRCLAARDAQQDRLLPEGSEPVRIGLIVEEIGESFGAQIVEGVEQACDACGYTLILKCTWGDQKREEEAIDKLLNAGAKGLIIMPVHGVNYNSAILKLYIENFPFVLIDRELKGIPASFVGTDNYQATVNLTKHLFELGHKKICYVAPTDNGTSSLMERRRGFMDANINQGILIRGNQFIDSIKSTLPYNKTEQMLPGDISLIMEYIKKNPDVTAFLAAEYNIGLIVSRAVKNLGLRVPEDISIVCFDSPANFVGDYRFTFVRQNEKRMGELGVELLQEAMKGPGKTKKVYLESEIVQGE